MDLVFLRKPVRRSMAGYDRQLREGMERGKHLRLTTWDQYKLETYNKIFGSKNPLLDAGDAADGRVRKRLK